MKTALTASLALAGLLFVAAGPAGAQGTTPDNCATVKGNIDWVLNQNMNYRQTFDQAMSSGLSPYDALLVADWQFPQVESTLRACADWAKDYLRNQGFGASK